MWRLVSSKWWLFTQRRDPLGWSSWFVDGQGWLVSGEILVWAVVVMWSRRGGQDQLNGLLPSTGTVRGTSRASIGLHVDEPTRTLVAVCAIDNLGKGSASQGVQCLNAVFGFAETEGLDVLAPVV